MLRNICWGILVSLCSIPSLAQVTIQVLNKGAYRAYYTISYTSYGRAVNMPEKTIDAGGNQSVNIPEGAESIRIVPKLATFIATYKTLATVQAGRSGGVLTFTGTTLDARASFAADDGISGQGNQTLTNLNQIYPNGDSELHRVARDANSTQMQILIDNGIMHVNTKNQRGFTPLHECIQKDFLPGIDMLIRSGANLTIENALGENPFVMAVGQGKMQAAQRLINNGHNAGADAKALEVAVRKRNDEMIRLLLDNKADPNKVISLALATNNVPLVEMVLDNYNPTITFELFTTAVDSRRIDLAKRLVEGGVNPNQALDYAISKNLPDVVQSCLEKGADPLKTLQYAIAQRKPDLAAQSITQFGANPNTVMEEAIRSGQQDIITLLLDNQADPNTALQFAIAQNKMNIVSALIDRGAKPTPDQMKRLGALGDNNMLPKLLEAGGDKNAALDGALGAKKYPTAELLVQAGATQDSLVSIAVINKQKNLLIAALDGGATAQPGLIHAINANLTDYADILFKGGATGSDARLIAIAITRGNAEMVSMLLQHGANAQGGLMLAIQNNNTAIAQLLLENGGSGSSADFIKTAIDKKNIAMVKLLLQKGATAQDGIVNAVSSNQVEMASILIEAGAKSSNQLLLLTAKNPQTTMAKLLIEKGAQAEAVLKPSITNNNHLLLALVLQNGVKPLEPGLLAMAVPNNNLELLNLLISNGCPTGHKDNNGNNLLHLAASTEAEKIVERLATSGVDVNEANNKKETPLHIAVVQGRSEVNLVEAFIKAGADVNAKNDAGKTPLALARGARIKKRLKEAGGIE